MLRRDALKILGLPFIPLPGLVMGPPLHARIEMKLKGVTFFAAPIEYRLNSIMRLVLEDIKEPLAFDRCALHRDGDSTPFLQHDFLPIHLTPGMNLELAWNVWESRDGVPTRGHDPQPKAL